MAINFSFEISWFQQNDSDYSIVPSNEKSLELEVGLKVIRMKEVVTHCDAESCWLVIHDYVYDVTDFLNQHPGGMDIVLEHGGRDATIPFTDVAHSSADVAASLRRYLIGILHKVKHGTKEIERQL
ncbi:hypothetical protein CAPTEDRAFT_146446 [Capitella teleta]|uniref:Cytochrome b5 heme-binding domain-containing protein n=1 Tax=Capitella teleta TaxID=283909 RepID=R7UU91_CAPTE|nr:hypothetical protein CAPTEDRAFT_146446 [Capitella teleta]|eukprot:ELU09760.1 hypothetical protein CAPTEDRAFT_146446 [Capitella teleta]